MMGHTTLKMITDKYFSYVPNMTHNDGSKFMEEYVKAGEKCGPNEAQAQGLFYMCLDLQLHFGGGGGSRIRFSPFFQLVDTSAFSSDFSR
jgi:hypothetical protein